MKGPVIAVSGIPGSGKTTLSRRAGAALGFAVVEYDRHETMTRQPPEALGRWLDRGAPLGELEAAGLAEAVTAAARRGGVILDTPFGGLLPATAGLVDATVWIDCPPDLALARKLRQILSTPGADPAALAAWLQGYLAAYESVVARACDLLRQRVRPSAQQCVDGRETIEACVAQLVVAAAGTQPRQG